MKNRFGFRFFSNEVWIQISIFLGSLVFFALNMKYPDFPYFDEFHYLVGAQDLIGRVGNSNWAHPPIGKILIGLGMKLYGTNATQWRYMSMLFGSISLLGMYHLALTLFRNRILALQVVVLCLLNQLLFVHARIATLEIFMFAFLIWGVVFYAKAWFHPDKNKFRNLCISGTLFALAIGTKWFGIIGLLFCVTLQLREFFIRKKVGWNWMKEIFVPFVFLPLVLYAVSFVVLIGLPHPSKAIPLTGEAKHIYQIWDIPRLSLKMLEAQLRYDDSKNEFQSSWITWPLMIYPMWYTLLGGDMNGQPWKIAVGCLGNPLIMWAGILAILYCFYGWFRKSKEAQFIVLLYAFLYLSWAIIPRKTTYFFYYFPAAMILSPAIVFAISKLQWPKWVNAIFFLVCMELFVFFYPVISGTQITHDEFLKRIWFISWW